MVKMKRMMLLVRPEQDEALKRLRQKTGASIGELIRRAIDLYLKQQKAGSQ